MKYYQIKNTDLNASAIIMGCMRIDSLSVKELDALVRAYLDRGVNFFDHADVYGMGSCESLFGQVLSADKSLRDRMILQGKCAIRKENGQAWYDFSKEHILSSVDAILSRLCTDHLDTLLLHRPDSLMEPEEVSEAFDELKRSGKVRYFGLSNSNPMQIELLQKYCGEKLLFDQVQLGVGHTVLIDHGLCTNTAFPQGADRSGSLIEYARLNDITLQAWSPLQYGMFEGVVLGNEKYIRLNEVLEEIGGELGISKAAVAIAWILRHPAKIQVICGSTKAAHMEDYIAATGTELTRAQWYRIYEAAGNPIP